MGFGADCAIVSTPVSADDEHGRPERAYPPRPRHGPGQTTSAGESDQPVARRQRPQRRFVRTSADLEGSLQPPAGGARGLKYAHLCSSCQLQRVTAEPGQTLELTCTACQRLPDTVQTLKRDLETKTRDAAYWQACYETLLGESYGRGVDDGAYQALR